MTRANARPRATEAPPLTEGDVPGLVAALSSSDTLAQQGALMGLTRVVPFEATRAALPLAQALAADAPDAEVRRQALSFLGGFAQEPGVLALLEKTLTASDVSVALAAVRALPAVPMALAAVRGALRHPDVEIRRNAAAALGRFAAASAELLEAFATALKDPARTVRSAAAQGAAVSAKGQAALGPVLRDVLKVEREGLVRALLVRALLETGGVTLPDAGVFVGLLAADPERSVRSGSAQLLGRMRAPTAVTALIEALEHDPDALVRGFAAEALGKLGPAARAAVPALLAMVKAREKLNHRAMAVTALAAIAVSPPPDVAAALSEAASDAEEETQAAAARALAALGLAVPPPLDPATATLRALDDADPQARSAAVLRVTRAATPIAPQWLPGLTRALGHPDALTRRYAAEVLGRAGPEARASVGALAAALLASQDSGLAREAARALVRVAADSPEVLDALARHLERGQTFVADASAEALATLGGSGVPALVRGLRSKEPYAGFAAAGALARVGPQAIDAVPALLELLADPARLTIRLSDGGGDSRSRVRAALEAIAPGDPRWAVAR